MLEQIKGNLLLFGTVVGGIFLAVKFLQARRNNLIQSGITQATTQDVLVGNKPPTQIGGFQNKSFLPNSATMAATERREGYLGASQPTPVPVSRHSRTHGK
jgi:hypothetical protein